MGNDLLLKSLREYIGRLVSIGVTNYNDPDKIFYIYGRLLDVKDNGDIVLEGKRGIRNIKGEIFKEIREVDHLNYKNGGA